MTAFSPFRRNKVLITLFLSVSKSSESIDAAIKPPPYNEFSRFLCDLEYINLLFELGVGNVKECSGLEYL